MLKKDLYNMRFAIIFISIYCIFMQIMYGTICPLKAFTGIPCPACGLTHATFYFFIGRFSEAFLFNPTVLLWIVTIFLFIFDRYIYKLKIQVFPYFFIVVSIITIIWYCINLTHIIQNIII